MAPIDRKRTRWPSTVSVATDDAGTRTKPCPESGHRRAVDVLPQS
ncbi:hypothetical protein I551_7800 [Mycobacterium ulcerans str. Harvey]|uniref:Uncharacterized protein n=1 Tax=Mycobacterium ulcerans str. Harvey TaxID=1299332 RepID=A0ABN0QM41_MYCUL|nr:hypothetical protein I551_7800 [Mycobacterium ulcerans str. Harvey]